MKSYQCNLIWYQKLLCACAIWNDEEAQAAIVRLLESTIRDGSSAWNVTTAASAVTSGQNVKSEMPTDQDWQEAARHSVRQGIAPLAARRLRAFLTRQAASSPNPDSKPLIPIEIPVEIMGCLERMLAANDRRNQVMLEQCARMMQAFHAEGIRCLALKGAALALAVYPDPGQRNFADIDLLVPHADYRRAGEIAVSIGFQSVFAEEDSALLHQAHRLYCEEDILTATLPLEFDADLSRKKIEQSRHWIVLEIHRGLFRDAAGFARAVEEAPLWENSSTVCLPNGFTGSLPSAEVMLVHLTTHAATHGFSRLQFSVDIAGVIDRYAATLDWEKVADLAQRYEVSSNVFRGLDLAQRVSGACVPGSILQRLTTATPGRARPEPIPLETLFAPMNTDSRDVMLRSLMLSSTRGQFARGLKNMLFPPPHLMRRLYGARHPLLIALLYGYRPLQLTGHLAELLLRRVWSKSKIMRRDAE